MCCRTDHEICENGAVGPDLQGRAESISRVTYAIGEISDGGSIGKRSQVREEGWPLVGNAGGERSTKDGQPGRVKAHLVRWMAGRIGIC